MEKETLSFDMLPIDAARIEKIDLVVHNHKRHGGIEITLLEAEGDTLVIRIKQTKKTSDVEYDGKGLIELVKPDFTELLPEYSIRWRPLVWQGDEIESLSASWVSSKMAKHSLKQKDLCDALKINRHVMSKMLNGYFEFTKWHKAAFYYYFKYIEIANSLGLDIEKKRIDPVRRIRKTMISTSVPSKATTRANTKQFLSVTANIKGISNPESIPAEIADKAFPGSK